MPSTIKKGAINFNDIASLKGAREKAKGRKIQFTTGMMQELKTLRDELDRKFMRPLVRKLRVEPPVRDRSKPVRWKTEKQRRFVMWMWKTGKIVLPYVRTHALSKGWHSKVEVLKDSRSNVVRILLENTGRHKNWKGEQTDITKFVVGEIGLGQSDRSLQRYRQPQQPFHQDTGWMLAATIIRPAVEKAYQWAQDRLKRWIDEGIKAA